MLFFFEQYRITNTLLKRQQQFQAALEKAEANRLPEGITAIYRAALTAHMQVQVELVRLSDVVAASFGDKGAASADGRWAAHQERVNALVKDVEKFERGLSIRGAGAGTPALDVAARQIELDRRRVELDVERLELLKTLGVRQGVAKVLEGLYGSLRHEVLDFDVAASRRRLGGSATDTGVKAGTDIALPGSGVLRDLSDAVDRYFDGQMIDDDKAQAHYVWVDTYRQAAEAWASRARTFLEFVPGAVP